jgi:hypothetical protein
VSAGRRFACAIVVVLLTAGTASAAPGGTAWTSVYDGPANNADSPSTVVADPTGQRVFVLGQSGGGKVTHMDIATIAYDATTGARLWVRRIDGAEHRIDTPLRLVTNDTGSRVYVVGILNQFTASERCVLVAYRASTGAQIWRRSCGQADPVIAANGTTLYAAGGRHHGTLTAYGADGSIVWSRALLAGTLSDVGGIGFAGGRLDVGVTELFGGIYTKWVLAAFDPSNGSKLWSRRYRAPDGRYADILGVQPTADGSRVYAVGDGTDDPRRLVVIAAFDGVTGDRIWRHTIAPVPGGALQSPLLAVSADGGTVAVGAWSYVSNVPTFFTRSYDAAGPANWTAREDAPGDSGYLAGIVAAPGGDVYVAGAPTTGGVHGSLTIAYDSTGGTAWTSLHPATNPAQGWSELAIAPDATRVYVTAALHHDIRTDAYLTS